MWQNIAIGMVALLLVTGLVTRMSQGSATPEPTGPRAPEYTKGWAQPDATQQPAPAPAAAAPAPAPAPAPAQPAPPPAPATAVQQLDTLWASQDWDSVISLLEGQQRAAAPIFAPPVLREKLYAAQVNAGHTLLRSGNANQARQYYQRAIEVDPSRPEARDALRTLP